MSNAHDFSLSLKWINIFAFYSNRFKYKYLSHMNITWYWYLYYFELQIRNSYSEWVLPVAKPVEGFIPYKKHFPFFVFSWEKANSSCLNFVYYYSHFNQSFLSKFFYSLPHFNMSHQNSEYNDMFFNVLFKSELTKKCSLHS